MASRRGAPPRIGQHQRDQQLLGPAAPFGGTGRSGVGRELSQWFLDSFTEAKPSSSTWGTGR
ncbi:hypothetical protein [Aeromicrobium sp. UC242_57]|uniref:hypothetical protein n=1 Tax=Aeromicrobium sp. UC242_57 TaxID=3374624 RepID=UPI0037A22C33